MDNYEFIIEMYKNKKEIRYLLMKLPKSMNIEILFNIFEKNEYYEVNNDIKTIFDNIKPNFDYDTRGNHVRYDNHKYARNNAVEFALKIYRNDLTKTDIKYFYNLYLYIQSHSHIFSENIRYHIKKLVDSKNILSPKQKKRIDEQIMKYDSFNYNNNDMESDTESEEEYIESCEDCHQSIYVCNCSQPPARDGW